MGRTELNEEELRRHEVLSRVERKEVSLREAAALLRVSYAQAKRLRQRYRQGVPRRCAMATRASPVNSFVRTSSCIGCERPVSRCGLSLETAGAGASGRGEAAMTAT